MEKQEVIKTFYKQLLEELKYYYNSNAERFGKNTYLANIYAEYVVKEICEWHYLDDKVLETAYRRSYYDTPEDYLEEWPDRDPYAPADLDEFEKEIFSYYQDNLEGFIGDVIKFAEKVCQKYPKNILCSALAFALKEFNYEKADEKDIDSDIDKVLDYIDVKPNIKTFIDNLENMSDEEFLKYKVDLKSLTAQEIEALKKYCDDKYESKRGSLYHASFSRERWGGESYWESSDLSDYEADHNYNCYKIMDKCEKIAKQIKEFEKSNENQQ